MPVLNQYIFQSWHGTDVQYRANTDGQLPSKLPFRTAPVVGRAYTITVPVRYQAGCKFPPGNLHIFAGFYFHSMSSFFTCENDEYKCYLLNFHTTHDTYIFHVKNTQIIQKIYFERTQIPVMKNHLVLLSRCFESFFL